MSIFDPKRRGRRSLAAWLWLAVAILAVVLVAGMIVVRV